MLGFPCLASCGTEPAAKVTGSAILTELRVCANASISTMTAGRCEIYIANATNPPANRRAEKRSWHTNVMDAGSCFKILTKILAWLS